MCWLGRKAEGARSSAPPIIGLNLCLNTDWLLTAHRHRRQPAKPVGLFAVHDAVKLFLNGSGDGSGHAFAHADLVNRTNRRNLSRGTGKEGFFRDVQEFARNSLLDYRNA